MLDGDCFTLRAIKLIAYDHTEYSAKAPVAAFGRECLFNEQRNINTHNRPFFIGQVCCGPRLDRSGPLTEINNNVFEPGSQ